MNSYKKSKCIFHIPYKIDTRIPSGSQIRPIKMLNAFKNIGYDVDIVMGYGFERKEQILKITDNIKKGIKYDFMYSESSTMPTLLTEKHHFPTYPFMDFSFFEFCKKNGIKIGLFYRDIHWVFPIYKKRVSFFKRISAISMYKHDLKNYKKLIDKLYLPSIKMYKYMPIDLDINSMEELPPGLELNHMFASDEARVKKKELKIFYVGGIGELYDLTKFLKTLKQKNYIKLTICCREAEWEKNKYKYENYQNDRISIVHKSGDDLISLYKEADILNLFYEPEEYRKFAIPVKLFEYLGTTKPIIATKGTAAGEFVKKNDIGWTIDYEEESLSQLLDYIYNNQYILNKKSQNAKKILDDNTWEARAKKVACQLSS